MKEATKPEANLPQPPTALYENDSIRDDTSEIKSSPSLLKALIDCAQIVEIEPDQALEA